MESGELLGDHLAAVATAAAAFATPFGWQGIGEIAGRLCCRVMRRCGWFRPVFLEAGGDFSFPAMWRASPAHAGVDRNFNVSAKNPAAASRCYTGAIIVK
jgi:hypothetical protein